MELTELKQRICDFFTGNSEQLSDLLLYIDQDVDAVYPFNQYEHLICYLIDIGDLNYQSYLDLRQEYIDANPNLWIFEISAPRGFGEKFAQTYVSGKSAELKKPSRQLDIEYSGQYDLLLDDNIRIEVKASRVVDADVEGPLYIRALSGDTRKSFVMNFQQLKPDCCDVFIWVAVFRDEIRLWVIPSEDIRTHILYSEGQHRGNHGNEGQVHIKHDNIHMFDQYILRSDENLASKIRELVNR